MEDNKLEVWQLCTFTNVYGHAYLKQVDLFKKEDDANFFKDMMASEDSTYTFSLRKVEVR